MMNMYREPEYYVKPQKDIFKGLKRTVRTSAVYRLAMLKKVEKAIKKTPVEDFETLKSIETVINRFSLMDDQFGPIVKEELITMFNRKMDESQDIIDRDLTQV